MRQGTAIAAMATALTLSACATAPRGPAGTLADAGTRATAAFATDVEDVALGLERADAGEAFTATWQVCQNPRIPCKRPAPSSNADRRRALAYAVRLRGQALDALGEAYGALRLEADYDGRADLAGAAKEAGGAVDAFAAAMAELSPTSAVAKLVNQPLTALAEFGGGLAGERSQRRRILRASNAIGAATDRLRIALEAEAEVFATLADYVTTTRTQARLALMDAGMVNPTELIAPMARDLRIRFSSGADAAIVKSPAAREAIVASVEALSSADVAEMQSRYRGAIVALAALARAHKQLEAGGEVSLEGVQRTLAGLDAALPAPRKEERP